MRVAKPKASSNSPTTARVPDGASVIRNVCDGAGDWSQVDTTLSGGVCESTFRAAGHHA